jgi:hypothetical protein
MLVTSKHPPSSSQNNTKSSHFPSTYYCITRLNCVIEASENHQEYGIKLSYDQLISEGLEEVHKNARLSW